MIDKLEARIKELQEAAEKSFANHNAILGALQEAKNNLALLSDGLNVVENVVAAKEECSVQSANPE